MTVKDILYIVAIVLLAFLCLITWSSHDSANVANRYEFNKIKQRLDNIEQTLNIRNNQSY